MRNPYRGLPDHQFWRRSISRTEPHRLDPVVLTRFQIDPNSKVATAGSCFAQNISRKLRQIGFNYYVPEAGEHLEPEQRLPHNYGVFSARFGNIYTTAQLRQLFDEAFGRRTPAETYWKDANGRFFDVFRQQVEPNGFATLEELKADREAHLAAVRTMFETSDVFIFTLGLTEAWRSKADGSVYSSAPGVVAGDCDPDKYEFVNFTVPEVWEELETFLKALKEVNPGIKVLLTVSPVPLIATFENRNVLVSTTYSKSVLRVVAEMAIKAFDWVDYFPSFEIFNGSFSGGMYYEPDHREVNHLGVAHAMRVFLSNYVDGESKVIAPNRPSAELIARANNPGVVCDEEAMDAYR